MQLTSHRFVCNSDVAWGVFAMDFDGSVEI